MARQSNADYWARRMKAMEDALLDRSYAYVENLETQFRAAQTEIERQMSAWYQRFAANNEITFADAKRLLSSDELEEFRWSVEEYIKYGKQNALDGAWMKQLENASAKVHVSRLEALKLQLQQQAESLYANQLDAVDAAARQAYQSSYYHTAFEIQRGLGVGWTMHAINEDIITKVLSRPWTADNQTFCDRCWANKQNLVNSVNTQLTQMIIRGEAPDRAIAAISKQFEVSKSKAGRLVMTESAYFSSAAQKDCFNALDVEQYRVVAALDHETCDLCGELDGKVFKMSEYQPGLTANPFHPWCRCCTAPYFEDITGERWAKDVVTGETYKVPSNMTYKEWKAQQDKLYGAGTVDLRRKISYNTSADKEQLKKYQAVLGRSGDLRGLGAFQELKYYDPDGYADLKSFFRYKSANPDSTRGFFEAEKGRRALVADGTIRAKGTLVTPPAGFVLQNGTGHAFERLAERGITGEMAQSYIDNAVFALKQQNGAVYAFYSAEGFAVIDTDGVLRTAGHLDEKGQRLFDEAVKRIGNRGK